MKLSNLALPCLALALALYLSYLFVQIVYSLLYFFMSFAKVNSLPSLCFLVFLCFFPLNSLPCVIVLGIFITINSILFIYLLLF